MDTKRLAQFGFLAVLVIVAVIGILSLFNRSSRQPGVAVSTGTFTMRPYNVTNDTWRVRSSRANGYSRVYYIFDETDLATMHVNSRNATGSIHLTFTQGDLERTVDISNEYYGYIDLSGFEPGEVRLRLEFEDAVQINITISWGEDNIFR